MSVEALPLFSTGELFFLGTFGIGLSAHMVVVQLNILFDI